MWLYETPQNITERKTPAFIIELHDVSPHTWADYAPLVEAFADTPDVRFSHLLVPDYHYRGRFDRYPDFLRTMNRRLQQGDDIALHGYCHLDEAPPPRRPGPFIKRRIRTHEGEFAALTQEQAASRIQAGVDIFRKLGWPLTGFVPPGWVVSRQAREAIRCAGFCYTASARGISRLPEGEFRRVPALVWSARALWRRVLSEGIARAMRFYRADAPVIRLALHPVDMRHARSRAFWWESIRLLRSDRDCLTPVDVAARWS